MYRYLLLILFCGFVGMANAQSDMLVLKKGDRTVQRFFAGTFITLQLDNMQWLSGYIKNIKKDTIQILPIEEQPTVNFLGMIVTDTIHLNPIKIPLHAIYAVPKNGSFSYIKDGRLIQIVSGGYIVLNVINTASSKDPVFGKDNIKNLGVAAGVFAVGTVMHALHRSVHTLGKRYYFQIIQISTGS